MSEVAGRHVPRRVADAELAGLHYHAMQFFLGASPLQRRISLCRVVANALDKWTDSLLAEGRGAAATLGPMGRGSDASVKNGTAPTRHARKRDPTLDQWQPRPRQSTCDWTREPWPLPVSHPCPCPACKL